MKRLFLLLLTGWILCLLGCSPALSEMPDDLLDTEYFTLPIPTGVSCTIIPDGDRYAIEFYENQDYETSGTGKLCTLKLFKDGEDFTAYDHMAYGRLVVGKESFQLIAIYPDEITYTPANANRHKELIDLISNRITYNLSPKDGCKWLVPQLEGPPISDTVIDMQYYTVNLPQGWVGKSIEFIEEFEDGTSIVTFYDKESYEDFGGGKLCAIYLITEDVDWTSVPDASLFGSLDTPDGRYIVVGSHPEDKQFNKDTQERYQAMSSLTSSLFSTFTPKDGCTLSRA